MRGLRHLGPRESKSSEEQAGTGENKPWRRRRDSNPRYRIYQYDGLANRWFQPLTHVSGSQRRAGPIARGREGGKGPESRAERLASSQIGFASSRIHCRFTRRGLSCRVDISRARERREIMGKLSRIVRRGWIAAIGAASLAASPAMAQIQNVDPNTAIDRSEEHTSELQSRRDLVCRLL